MRPMSTVEADTPEEAVAYCTVHTSVETTLRCNKCGRPMCTRCAVRTPVGYRCKECVKGQQAIFFNSRPLDPVIQVVISLVLSAVAAALISLISRGLFWYGYLIAIFAGSAAGGVIADLAHRAVGRRRGRYSWLVVAGGIVIGALPMGLLGGSIGWIIYLVAAPAAAVGRLRLGRRINLPFFQ